MLQARTHTHKLQRGFLHVFDTVGLGCNMKDLLTPLRPCKTYQMAQNGGPFWLPYSVGCFFFYRRDAFQRSTHHHSDLKRPTFTRNVASTFFIHTAEVKPPPSAAHGFEGGSGRAERKCLRVRG